LLYDFVFATDLSCPDNFRDARSSENLHGPRGNFVRRSYDVPITLLCIPRSLSNERENEDRKPK